jgi:hypothetical protein
MRGGAAARGGAKTPGGISGPLMAGYLAGPGRVYREFLFWGESEHRAGGRPSQA